MTGCVSSQLAFGFRWDVFEFAFPCFFCYAVFLVLVLVLVSFRYLGINHLWLHVCGVLLLVGVLVSVLGVEMHV